MDPAINDALRIVTGCLRPTPADNLLILAGIQSAELRRKGATLSLTLHAMESGHLFHSALTRSSSANAGRLKSRHPFVSAAQQLLSLSDNSGAVGGSPMECGMGGQSHKTPHFHSRHPAPIPPEGPSKEEPGSGLTASAPVSGVSSPVCTNGVWLALRPVSVEQKNKPSTMLSSNVQSIDLFMNCTA